MFCRKTFEELLDAKSPVKPFSFSYDGKPCERSQENRIFEVDEL